MTEEQFQKAKKLREDIALMKGNAKNCTDIKDGAFITVSELDEDIVHRWVEINKAFWENEAERLKKELEAM